MEKAIDEITTNSHCAEKPDISVIKTFLDTGIATDEAGNSNHKEIMLSELLRKHETTIVSLRKNMDTGKEKAGDPGTVDLLTGLLKQQEAIVGILKKMSKS